MRLESLRILLALVAIRDYDIIQFDFTSDYLYGTLKEEVYMEKPSGYQVPGRNTGSGSLRRGSMGWCRQVGRGTMR